LTMSGISVITLDDETLRKVERRFRALSSGKVAETLAEIFMLTVCGEMLKEKWNYLEWRLERKPEWIGGKTQLLKLFQNILGRWHLSYSEEDSSRAFEVAVSKLIAQEMILERKTSLRGKMLKEYRITEKGYEALRRLDA